MKPIWKESISIMCLERKVKRTKSYLNKVTSKSNNLFDGQESQSCNDFQKGKNYNQEREQKFLEFLQNKKDSQSPILVYFQRKMKKCCDKTCRVRTSDPEQPKQGSISEIQQLKKLGFNYTLLNQNGNLQDLSNSTLEAKKDATFSASPILQGKGADSDQIKKMDGFRNKKLIPTLQKQVIFDICLNSLHNRRHQKKKQDPNSSQDS